ncbi:Polynucleotidyl transferase ribonuclease H-like superfamily protein [Zea mays]|uniref:Polynucleotidyl transferase ribonuclease H-like superfamily protein n=1 Tax=Zea mays TaxID=4577 RepID=A0A1D6NAU6_MAIZE|nr:Polynucleotidyl transferase ribonuclease H-like superfamily protein [Zea mays]
MRLLQAEELFRKVLEVGSKNKAARLLGLDVGSKYVGVAISDEKNRVAMPLSVLCRTKTNINLMADDFKTLAIQVSLAGELCKTGKLDDLPYAYWDENFTSKCVEALLHPLNLKDLDDAKTMTDKFAAVCILQGYLDNMNRKLRSTDKSEA